MNILYKNVKKFFQSLSSHHVSEYTAQCAYYAILSSVPLLILIVTLVQYTGITKDALIETIQSILPATMSNATFDIVQEVYSKSIGTISISAIFVLWSARKWFYALLKGLHNIYEINTASNFLRAQLKSILLTLGLVVLTILILVLSVFGDTILEYIQFKINIPEAIKNVFRVSRIGVYLVLFLVVLLMYRFIPGHKSSIKKQVPGAIIATLGWYVISLFFSIYIDTFKGFSVMYGSLTTIILAMMWVYFCMYIILLGAEFNCFLSKKKYVKAE